jgi:FKBP-type peptidyl-prolyl cis-trans isomerase FklB
VPLEPDALVAGIRDAIEGGDALLSEEDRRTALTELRNRILTAEQSARQQESEKNLADAKAWLDANRTKEGVQTTASGLQYKVVKQGSGEKPAASNTVSVHYRGTLTDGSEFDSSYERGEPATFPLDRVIPGWTEGLQLMSEGATYELYVPPDLAYGEHGAGDRIPPQSALVFQVELLDAKVE